VVASLQAAIDELGGRASIRLWATAARTLGTSVPFVVAREQLKESTKPLLLVFGTGWGLAPSVIEEADTLLEPIGREPGDYNHLSVRSACAIALDRLFGAR
jgi:hypothetical protein